MVGGELRTVLFHCRMRNFRGAHLKLWNYFEHVLAAPGFTARVTFTDDTRWDETNPWRNAREYVVDDWRTVRADVFFLGGRQWEVAERHPDWGPNVPVINFIQHVHHADAENDRYRHLRRPAVRICVAQEVRDALLETGVVGEPLVVIPNGIDLSEVVRGADDARDVDVLVAALKRPDLGREVARRLEQPGRRVRLLTERMPRPDYLAAVRRSRVTVFLPNDTEGFYLPALEGLAAGTLVVCPDCIGNRSFCLPHETSFLTSFAIDDMVDAAETALALPAVEAARLRANGAEMAERYSLRGERAMFHRVLADIDALWAEANAQRATVPTR